MPTHLKVSRKDFVCWPEKLYLPFWQLSFCPGVEIPFEIWILAHFCRGAQGEKCAKIQISKEISTPGQKLRCQNGRREFSGLNLKFFRDKVTFNFFQKHFHPTHSIGRLFAYSLNYFLEKCHPTCLIGILA